MATHEIIRYLVNKSLLGNDSIADQSSNLYFFVASHACYSKLAQQLFFSHHYIVIHREPNWQMTKFALNCSIGAYCWENKI